MKKVSRHVLMAIGLTAAVVVWMASGLLSGSNSSTSDGPPSQAQEDGTVMAVSVRLSEARQVNRSVQISARTEANRRVEIAAETEGRVVDIGAERGRRIAEGELIARLDQRDRAALETEAEALVRQRELDYEAAQRLGGREFLSQSQIAEAQAQLESARAALTRVRMDIARTEISAPFAGVIEERAVELGDYVGIGDAVATLVDLDPLIIAGDVSEREIFELREGSEGIAQLPATGNVKGRVRYVSPVADEATRTFRVELAIPNPDDSLRGGISARIRLPTGSILAHRLTPALLALDDDGQLGVKTVDDSDRVRFHPVEIVESDSNGIWVSGLPNRARVITLGQGFVNTGEIVRPVLTEDVLPTGESGP